MSMDATAIEHIQQNGPAAEASVRLRSQGLSAVIVPKNCDIQNIEHLQEHRNRFRAELKTNSLEDFVAYYHANEIDMEGSTQVFVQPESMTAKAIFNLYELDGEPGHGDHTASLCEVKTAPFKSLLKIDGTRMSQKDFAEWMEDWRDHLKATDSQGEELNLTKAIAAIRRITIEATAKSDTEVRSFGASRSAMESIEAKSEDQLPAFLEFTCNPYKDLGQRTFQLRVGILTGEKQPVLVARIIKLEEHEETMAFEFKGLINAALPDGAPIYLGAFALNR
ncbi:DUF2303 family protein [Microbulbifer salipaludis]|uniref:DUF2303 family protein n=1 Tax=Microbulbifer salipaludis TaxID=187980 RepID=A0ABS3E950_9GAMM|nr:DUF2303 family protein [Microbulbifer salipaludis]MBN8431839.1 DUF2303 family protein [Microbulbifer salipaludis]